MVFSRIILSDGTPRDHQTSNRSEVLEAMFLLVVSLAPAQKRNYLRPSTISGKKGVQAGRVRGDSNSTHPFVSGAGCNSLDCYDHSG